MATPRLAGLGRSASSCNSRHPRGRQVRQTICDRLLKLWRRDTYRMHRDSSLLSRQAESPIIKRSPGPHLVLARAIAVVANSLAEIPKGAPGSRACTFRTRHLRRPAVVKTARRRSGARSARRVVVVRQSRIDMLLPNFHGTKTLIRSAAALSDLKGFRKLCPRRDEVPLLAHVRCVDPTTRSLGEVADGDSRAGANRFPPQAQTQPPYFARGGICCGLSEQQYSLPACVNHSASWSFLCASRGTILSGADARLQQNAAVGGARSGARATLM